MAADGSQAQYPWAVQFPYGSPAHVRQWEERRTTIPAELVSVRSLRSHLVPAHALAMSVERRESINQRVRESEKALAEARAAKKGSGEIRKLQGALEAAKIAQQKEGLADVAVAQRFPSRQSPERISSVSELEHLAGDFQSLPVHPAQLYASVHAILLSGVLSAIFYRRKRHGLVIGMLLVLYPIGRVMLEIIRTDNPHDVAGLTVSQSVSLAMFVVGVAYLIILYKLLPQRSPAAAAARPKDDTGSQKHGD